MHAVALLVVFSFSMFLTGCAPLLIAGATIGAGEVASNLVSEGKYTGDQLWQGAKWDARYEKTNIGMLKKEGTWVCAPTGGGEICVAKQYAHVKYAKSNVTFLCDLGKGGYFQNLVTGDGSTLYCTKL